jgi:hypothetical protein
MESKRLLTVCPKERRALENALLTLVNEIACRRVVFVPFSEELGVREAGTFFDEDSIVWSLGVRLALQFPKPKCRALMKSDCKAAVAHRYFRKTGLNPAEFDHSAQSTSFYAAGAINGTVDGINATPITIDLSKEKSTGNGKAKEKKTTMAMAHSPAALRAFRILNYTHRAVGDRVFADKTNPKRRPFLYRPDIGIMDKYRTVHRHLRPGFGSGRAEHDFRGLGLHTPGFAQPPYFPLRRQGKAQ